MAHPRPLPGLQPATRPVAGFRSPAGGPLSVLPTPPPSAWRFFLPASGNGVAELSPSDPLASSGRLMLRRLGSCLVIAIRRLLPGEGVGLACLRLTVPVRLRSAILAATFPDSPPSAFTHAPRNEVPADPAPASRCSLRSRLSLSALVLP